MAYNMSAYSDSTNIFEMFQALNTASNSLLAYSITIAVFIVLLIVLMRNNPPAESFTGASTVTTVFCLMFLLADLVNIVWVIGSSIITASAVVKLYFQ